MLLAYFLKDNENVNSEEISPCEGMNQTEILKDICI